MAGRGMVFRGDNCISGSKDKKMNGCRIRPGSGSMELNGFQRSM